MFLHVLAAMAGLAAPRLIGDLVQDVSTGTTVSTVDKTVAAIAVFLLAADGADPLRPLPLVRPR